MNPPGTPIAGDGGVVKLRVLDLFSGIGGFSLGLEAAGFVTAAFCEISPKCRHLLRHHWPEVPIYDDICTLTGDRLTADGLAIDAICGGFPCQDISFAGRGAGLAGERSGLWREYARLIRELRPRVVVVENVAALLGRGLGDVLGDLAALGYDAWWDCIPASAVGAPHRRDRLWIVAYPRGEQHESYGDALRRSIAAELLAPDTEGDGWIQGIKDGSGRAAGDGPRAERGLGDGGEALADASRKRQPKTRGLRRDQPAQRTAGGGKVVANRQVRERDDEPASRSCQHQGRIEAGGRAGVDWREWLSEPDVGRVAHGVPARVDRLHGLGNAVVPEIPYRLGRAIMAARLAA